MNIDDGGPAFPRPYGERHPAHGEPRTFIWNNSQKGMSLRDYFAGQAMQALASHDHETLYDPRKCDEDFAPDPNGTWYRNPDKGLWYQSGVGQGDDRPPHKLATSYEYRLARDAYAQADAMLAIRQKEAKAQ